MSDKTDCIALRLIYIGGSVIVKMQEVEMNMQEECRWKFCAVGNIVKTHVDAEGILRYGSAAYTGGTKVYLRGKYWSEADATIPVIGLNRDKRFQVNDVPVELIENVRFGRTFKPSVLDIMDDWEFFDCWWHTTAEDRRQALAFVTRWNAHSRSES